MASFLARAFDLPIPELDVSTTLGAEVMNLTRHVKIEGTAGGRAHVFVRSSSVSTIEYVEIRHVGPRPGSAGVLGRYGLHFHANFDDTRGTIVKGVVVAQAGFHAFVPHLSHGITLQDCVSYDTFNHAYWWDTPPTQGIAPDESDDTLIANCLAGYVQREEQGFRMSGFSLNAGQNNTIIGCVAVGIQAGGKGFNWPELSHGVWNFRNNVGHNSRGSGTFVWHNGNTFHDVSGLVAYRNRFAGIDHGAYNNSFQFSNCLLVDNGDHGIHLHSGSRRSPTLLTFKNCVVDGPNPIATTTHNLPPGTHTQIVNCELISTNGTLGYMNGNKYPDLIKVIDGTRNTSTIVWDNATSDSEFYIIEDGVTVMLSTP